jgi:hypothetical protein
MPTALKSLVTGNTKKTHRIESLNIWQQLKLLVHTVNVVRLQNLVLEEKRPGGKLPSLVFSYQALETL